MFEAFLITTSSDGLQPLGSAPQRSFELVNSTVKNQLGQGHANVFAEPVASEHGDMIDWYAPMEGTAVPLPDLDADQQADIRQKLGALVADIQSTARELNDSANADDQRLGEALDNAIEIPDETMIRVVRDADGVLHPVLVHWGWIRDEQTAVRGVLTGMVAREKPAVPVSPAVVPVAGTGLTSPAWWWLILLGWLLLAVLLAAILYVLIAPCGINQGRLIFCPVDAEAFSAVDAERLVIEDRVLRLEHELALTDRVCRPTIPVLPASPAPSSPAPKGEPELPAPADPAPTESEDATQTEADRADVDRRMTERGAARGDLNFALEWDTTDDIDLEVTCPSGQVISYKNPTDCDGTYDLDANVKRDTAIEDPVENIVFQPAKPGIYKVRAYLKGNRTEGDKTVTLHVLRKDGPSQSYSGTVGKGRPEWSLNISISR